MVKYLCLILTLSPSLFYGQTKSSLKRIENRHISFQKNYTYKVSLKKISCVSFPKTKVQLKLAQNAAVLNDNEMLYPEVKSDFESLYNVCPIILYGYKREVFNVAKTCNVKAQPALEFVGNAMTNFSINMQIPKDQLTSETKLIFGIYGAVLVLPNGTTKKLTKANVRSFKMADFNYSVRNYIKYEFLIDDATIALEYVVERVSN